MTTVINTRRYKLMDLIRASEAAEILGVRRQTVYEWVKSGKLTIAMQIRSEKRAESLFSRAYIEEVAKHRHRQQPGSEAAAVHGQGRGAHAVSPPSDGLQADRAG
jgi:excisionase family DNA binding protein